MTPKPADLRHRAAEYVRMSTDHQQYSTENQRSTIAEYALKHGLTIVRTYADEGKSGLRLEGRTGLKQLLADAGAQQIDFAVLLVYDVSRWGRFQDADESAYYEFVLKQVGVSVAYCAEPFSNDGTPISTIMKSVKRAMAGEYSRELSSKVFQGQCRLIQLGYRQGGPAGFGLRRMLLDERGQPKGLLKRGERKSLQMERVVLVPGPVEEQEVVREIYAEFIAGRTEGEIARLLNERAMYPEAQRPWTRTTVRQVLTNEKYAGCNVFNRRSFKLKQRRVRNPEDIWVRRPGSFEPVVSQELFDAARSTMERRSLKISDEELLQSLRRLYEERGTLSGLIIEESSLSSCVGMLRTRFGSLIRAYQLVGFTPERDYAYIAINAHLRRLLPQTVASVVEQLTGLGVQVQGDAGRGTLDLNGEVTVSIIIARCQATPAGRRRWKLRFGSSAVTDLILAVRMGDDNESVLDYYIIPREEINRDRLNLADENGLALDAFRFDSLDYFAALGLRARIGVA